MKYWVEILGQILGEILGQPELTPFRLNNKGAEPSGTIFVFVRGFKKGQFYSSLCEFGLLYRGYRFVRESQIPTCLAAVILEPARSRMLN